ncbi:large ribosomal subunit protein uL23-like [Meriones unguiculatus]|uniref:large ribosomal subunit protein uL23-like n=1 Tax=Meriones unguiculatus TaxID=10047 RepID=UPI00293F2830|nr:large ribosomal subunit protein uL23-like [Meriones unguiculatus]
MGVDRWQTFKEHERKEALKQPTLFKVKKEALAPPKAKAKALKAKTAVLKGVHSHKKKICIVTQFPVAQDPAAPEAASEECTQEKQAGPLCHHQMPPDHQVIHEENREYTSVHVNVKSNKHQIKQAMKKLHDIDVAKANTLIRPDREKKAYVRLAPNDDDDALDVAKKIGI